jgi:eukaryotic-like serine/threonine-protein kinase
MGVGTPDVDVVIRQVSPELAGDRHSMRRVRRDMEVLSGLRHTNLLSVIAFDATVGEVMYEAVGGTTLSHLLESDGPLDLPAAMVLYDDCLAGLDALHNAGVCHGGLNSKVVVIEVAGAVMLGDAGIASAPAPGAQSPTAPTTLDGHHRVQSAGSVAADLYAAAAVFRESLTGGSRSGAAVGRTKSRRRVERDVAIKPSVPMVARELLSRGLDHNAEARWSSAAECRRDVAAAGDSFLGNGWRRLGRSALAAAATARSNDPASATNPFGRLDSDADPAGGEPPAGEGRPRSRWETQPQWWRNPLRSPIPVALGPALAVAALLLVASTLLLVHGLSNQASAATANRPPVVTLPSTPKAQPTYLAPLTPGAVAGVTAPPATAPPVQPTPSPTGAPARLFNLGFPSANPTSNPRGRPTPNPTPRPTPPPPPPPTPTPPPPPTPTPPTPTPAPTGTITGTVTDTSNAPIAGASVSWSGGGTTTDGNGNYLLTGLADGTYDVTFSAAGHQSQTVSVTVSGGNGSANVTLS